MLSNDTSFCKLVRSYLEHVSIGVLSCTAVDRAECFMRQRTGIDLWVIDVEAIGIEGLYIATRLDECRPEMPILVLEGDRPDNELLAKFLSDDWARIDKRVPLPRLLSTVLRLLEQGIARKRCRSVGVSATGSDRNVA